MTKQIIVDGRVYDWPTADEIIAGLPEQVMYHHAASGRADKAAVRKNIIGNALGLLIHSRDLDAYNQGKIRQVISCFNEQMETLRLKPLEEIEISQLFGIESSQERKIEKDG